MWTNFNTSLIINNLNSEKYEQGSDFFLNVRN